MSVTAAATAWQFAVYGWRLSTVLATSLAEAGTGEGRTDQPDVSVHSAKIIIFTARLSA
jgi:hypothetical protein